MKRTIPLAVLAATAALVAGCGGSSESDADAQSGGATTAATTATTVAAPGTTTTPAAGRVSANSASEDDLVAALGAAGVKNAEKWADEIVEYRPYPSDDTSFAKLRQELAKYNPAPDELDRIISVLTP